jgi:hypothetical protein
MHKTSKNLLDKNEKRSDNISNDSKAQIIERVIC